jgi:TatD DNase family protein
MKYFDTHAHLMLEPLVSNIDKIIGECKKRNILINNVGVDINTSKQAVVQAKKYSLVFATVGIHPTETNINNFTNNFEIIEAMLKNKSKNRIIAIGETGLDYFHKPFDKEVQKKFFLKQIELANKYNLPLILHIRDAHDDAYEILKKSNIKVNIVIHCFDSTPEMAKKYIDLGMYIGIGGLITNVNKQNLCQTIIKFGISHVLSETDCPFLTPQKYKPSSNKPLFMLETINKIKNILKSDSIEEKLFTNAINFFFKN